MEISNSVAYWYSCNIEQLLYIIAELIQLSIQHTISPLLLHETTPRENISHSMQIMCDFLVTAGYSLSSCFPHGISNIMIANGALQADVSRKRETDGRGQGYT